MRSTQFEDTPMCPCVNPFRNRVSKAQTWLLLDRWMRAPNLWNNETNTSLSSFFMAAHMTNSFVAEISCDSTWSGNLVIQSVKVCVSVSVQKLSATPLVFLGADKQALGLYTHTSYEVWVLSRQQNIAEYRRDTAPHWILILWLSFAYFHQLWIFQDCGFSFRLWICELLCKT